MSQTPAEKNETAKEREALRIESIGRDILAKLGTPPNFSKIDVIPVKLHSYRINVCCAVKREGEQVVFTEQRITDSFFAWESIDGTLRTDPPIKLKYGGTLCGFPVVFNDKLVCKLQDIKLGMPP